MREEAALEALFEGARALPPEVPKGLLVRVAADAEKARPKRRGWRERIAGFGGVPGLGGLITASCVGFWLGVAPPAGLPDVAGAVLGVAAGGLEETAALDETDGGTLNAFGWDFEEG